MRTIKIFLALLLSSTMLFAQDDVMQEPKLNMDIDFRDPHSFSHPDEAVVQHLHLDAKVDFENKVISGTATYKIVNKTKAKKIIFDTYDLEIVKVMIDTNMQEAAYRLGDKNEILGQALEVKIGKDTEWVHIQYKTKPRAKALQWLDPVQTKGKKHPFLFTQSQAILARSWIPCQDGPGIRFTYTAKIEVPKDLIALMSASNPQKKNETGIYEFQMSQPVPSYLMALAVGDVGFMPLGPRAGVYAEHGMLSAAAKEFSDTEKMIEEAEKLYGPYRWERYDIIVLPPSFPFGGMENPRLTFATPTIIAGDKSLTALIAHELAHSWSGNLVTNATWDDFWLNEGFTVYFEKRIMEAVYGKSYVEMLTTLGRQDLDEEIHDLGPKSADTHLKLVLDGRDPDDGMTDIAYEKGSLFLETIEHAVGREKFDAFLKAYFTDNAFKTITTEAFIEHLNKELIKGDADLEKKISVDLWVYGPGIPDGAPKVASERLKAVDEQLRAWGSGTDPFSLITKDWSTHEWLHFIRNLPKLSMAKMVDLDRTFKFSRSGNNEILGAWFILAVRHEYTLIFPVIEEFLISVGRRKFLTPIYREMLAHDEGRKFAKQVYPQARPNYHSVAKITMDELLKDVVKIEE